MNIFVLDKEPVLCAQYHCNKHVVKMILEGCQILSTVAREKYKFNEGYKSCFKNHPVVKWTMESDANYLWLCMLTEALCNEYTFRYNRTHKCSLILGNLIVACLKCITQKESSLTKFYLVMPDDCKTNCPVESYRNYYLNYKQNLLTYTKREIPFWIKEKGLGIQK